MPLLPVKAEVSISESLNDSPARLITADGKIVRAHHEIKNITRTINANNPSSRSVGRERETETERHSEIETEA